MTSAQVLPSSAPALASIVVPTTGIWLSADEDVVAQVLVALEHEAEDRRRREEQREDRQEPLIGEHRRVATGLVAAEPVERLDGHVDDREAASGGHHGDGRSTASQRPVDGLDAGLGERRVGAAERAAPEEPVAGRQRRRVRRFDDRVAGGAR